MIKTTADLAPIKATFACPKCGWLHIDRDEWLTKPHKTHICEHCTREFRPYEFPTIGVDWDQDDRTFSPERLLTLPEDTRREIGCFYNGPDDFTYRVVGWRFADGPWIEEVMGRRPTRTISLHALGRTFHHHKLCPCDRRECSLSWRHRLGEMSDPVLWLGSNQRSDGYSLWVSSETDPACLGRISAASATVFSADGRVLWTQAGARPGHPRASFYEFFVFQERLSHHHSISVSQATPIRLRAER